MYVIVVAKVSCTSLTQLQAIARMKESVGSEKELKVEFLKLDLASFQSTKDFVRSFKEKNLPLHILINNAAVAGIPFSKCHETPTL